MILGVETQLIDMSAPTPTGGAYNFCPAFLTFSSKGKVNKPTFVSNAQEMFEKFGDADLSKKQYGLFAAYEYFKSGSTAAYIIRCGADQEQFASSVIYARDGKPLLTVTTKIGGEFGNSFRAKFQDINPVNFDGVATMQLVLEMKNPLTTQEWIDSGETIAYPEYIQLPSTAASPSRFNIDFMTNRIYSAVNNVDEVNNFGEFIYNAQADTCIKQLNELVGTNETADFVFSFERDPLGSTLLIEKLTDTVYFKGGSSAILSAWTPIFNKSGLAKYLIAKREFDMVAEDWTIAKNEYITLPLAVQKYVKDKGFLTFKGFTRSAMLTMIFSDKLYDYLVHVKGLSATIAKGAMLELTDKLIKQGLDTASVDVGMVDSNGLPVLLDVVKADVEAQAKPVTADTTTYRYYLTASEDNFLTRNITTKECPRASVPGVYDSVIDAMIAAPLSATFTYNAVVRFNTESERLDAARILVENVKKDKLNQTYAVYASSPGEWGNAFQVKIKFFQNSKEIQFTVLEERGADLVEVESHTCKIDELESIGPKRIEIYESTMIDMQNPNTFPVNMINEATATEIPMPLMGGADMFTEADYENDDKLKAFIIGSIAHGTGVWALENTKLFKFDALFAPMFSKFGEVSGEMVILAESRRDFHCVIDTPNTQAVGAMNWYDAGNHNSKFESIFFPWVKKWDAYAKKTVAVPASGSIAYLLGQNGRNLRLCDAMAGVVRGVVPDAVGLSQDMVISQGTMEKLYAKNINPIIKTAEAGIHVNGQKTTYAKGGALSRMATMRIVEKMVQEIPTMGQSFIHEIQEPATQARVIKLYNDYLSKYTMSGCVQSASASLASSNTPTSLAQGKLIVAVKVVTKGYLEEIIIPIGVE